MLKSFSLRQDQAEGHESPLSMKVNHNYNKIVKSDWLSTSLTNGRGSRVAGLMSRVAGPMSRSRVQCRGRGSNVAAGENDLKTTDMKTI